MGQSKSRAKLYRAINGANGAQVLTAGGALGTANIAFTANPTAGDTITVTTARGASVFTFSASASDNTTINIKGSLALTLAEAETVIQGNTEVGLGNNVICNVDVTDTDTDLTFRFFPGADIVSVVSSTDGANTTDTAVVAGTNVEVNSGKSEVLLEWADASSSLTYVTLPNGTVDGQMIEFYAVSVATSGDSVGVIGSYASGNNLMVIGGTTSFIAGEGSTLYWDAANQLWKEKVGNDSVFSALEDAAL